MNGEDRESISGLATALISARRYADALPLLEQLSNRERALQVGMPGRGVEIATIQWILGLRAEAMQIARDLTRGILDGTILYADGAGGVTQGTLLYYMAASIGDLATVEYALSYLKTLASKPRIQQWPGPIAQFLIRKVTLFDLLKEGTGTSELAMAISKASRDLLTRRRLCNILFADGVVHRSNGDEALCIQRMKECEKLTNPLLEMDWFLARDEVDREASPME